MTALQTRALATLGRAALQSAVRFAHLLREPEGAVDMVFQTRPAPVERKQAGGDERIAAEGRRPR
jgi:hypothetical protein